MTIVETNSFQEKFINGDFIEYQNDDDDDEINLNKSIENDATDEFFTSSLEFSSSSNSSANSSNNTTPVKLDILNNQLNYNNDINTLGNDEVTIINENELEKKKAIRKKILGFVIVILITVFYSAISELNQYILSGSYNKPYALVYYNTLYLLLAFPIEAVLLKRDQIKERKRNIQTGLNSDPLEYKNESLIARYKNEFIKANFSFKRMMIVSFFMSLLYVGLNWIWSLGLPLTEVSTSNALYQSATIWVFLFSIVILKDRPTILKSISVALFIGGVIGITVADKNTTNSSYPHAVIGDILMIISALLWALYEVFTTKFVGNVPRTLVNTYIGMIAFWSTIYGIPVLIIISVTGFESWQTPDLKTFGFLTLSAIVAFLLNYLINWGLSVTSPLFVRSGELMTIPTTLVFDIIVKHVSFPLVAIPGFLCIVAGFIIMLYIESRHTKVESKETTVVIVSESESEKDNHIISQP